MNQRSMIAIGAVIFVVGISFFIFRSSPAQRPNPKPVPSPTPTPLTLLDYTDIDDAQVSFSIEGRVIAKEQHYSQTITVAKLHRQLDLFQSYSGTAYQTTSLDNSQPAFDDFMHAIHDAGFESSTKNPKAAATDTGLCPFGQRYTYQFTQGGKTLMSNWSTTCGDPTNFTGNANTIRTLFQLQIPNYPTLVSSVRL